MESPSKYNNFASPKSHDTTSRKHTSLSSDASKIKGSCS